MRVLHLTPELPYEGGGGGRPHEYYMCRRLVERGHQVLNISPILPSELQHVAALRDVGVENWIVERPDSQLSETLHAMRADPRVLLNAVALPVRALEMRVFWIALRDVVLRAVQEWKPDVLVVGHDMSAVWTRELPPDLPAVLTLHNLTWRWYESRAHLREGPLALPLRVEAMRYRRFLLRRLPRFDAAVAVSAVEAQELRRMTDLPVSVIPIGVDTQVLRPEPEPAGPPRILFSGTLGYPPNRQGITWFADRVWPQVLGQLPEAQLDIVGRDPPPSVKALAARSGIDVVGPVPAMGPYFARAALVIVPILAGAGIRVKLLEAMAAGRAIVSTSLGAEGIEHLEPGRHLLIADGPEEFAAAAIDLLQNPDRRRQLALDARVLSELRYDWRRLGDDLELVLKTVVDRARAGRSAPSGVTP